MWCVVGLGNPGTEYDASRHNAGFMAIDALLAKHGLAARANKKLEAALALWKESRRHVVLAKPQTFMNLSGRSVQALLSFYKLPAAQLIVIHDDKDIPLGHYRLQQGRGSAGHNGVASIIETLGTNAFTRLRVGVAPPESPIADTAAFVLGDFTPDEKKVLQAVLIKVLIEVEQLTYGT